MRRNLQNRNCFMTQTPPLLSDYVTNPLELVPNKACMFKDWGGGASLVALVVKNLPASLGDVRDTGLIPGSGRSLEKSKATHSSILAWKIPRDKGAWWATVHGVAKSQT